MTSPGDLAQFGKWLTERQDKLVTDLWKEQRQSQENLLKGLCEVLKERSTPLSQADRPSSTIQYRLSKLNPEDDIEAFLQAFEATALVAGWEKNQWATVFGPYLLLKTLPVSEIPDYDRVKAAILDHYEVTPKTQRQRF